jgi:RimJ/RimL family protein N-acetyltransferase
VIQLRPWTEDDMSLLAALNSLEMTEHLGGPESQEQLDKRLLRYVAAQSHEVGMFVVMVDGVPAGSVGFWEREWRGGRVYETGWSVLPEFQGHGVASRATSLAIGIARATGRNDAIHAFPAVDNGPSNAICRKLRFELLGECEFEYPKGHWALSNDWQLSLR